MNMLDWHPIETAYDDNVVKAGGAVLLWNGHDQEIGWYRASVNHYQWRDRSWHVITPQPTHYMRLPLPPFVATLKDEFTKKG